MEEMFSKVRLHGDTKLEVMLHDRNWCIRQNMGGVLGVSSGSDQEPYFVEINYVVSLNYSVYNLSCEVHRK